MLGVAWACVLTIALYARRSEDAGDDGAGRPALAPAVSRTPGLFGCFALLAIPAGDDDGDHFPTGPTGAELALVISTGRAHRPSIASSLLRSR
jgi:hypothetical protein